MFRLVLVPVACLTIMMASACDSSNTQTPPTRTAEAIDASSASFRLTPHAQPTIRPQPTSTPVRLTFDNTAITPAPVCQGCLILAHQETTMAFDPRTDAVSTIAVPPANPALSPYPAFFPSPDGRTFAYGCNGDGSWSPEGPATAVCLSGAGAPVTPVVAPSELARPLDVLSYRIAWSPNSRYFVFFTFIPDDNDFNADAQETDVYFHDVATGSTALIVPGEPLHAFGDAAWSPNSEYVAIPRTRNGIYSNVIVFSPGSGATQLIPPDDEAFATSIDSYVWSPDSRNIAVSWTTIEPRTPTPGVGREFRQQHFFASLADGVLRELPPDLDGRIIAISPDNQWLLVDRIDDGTRLHVVDAVPVNGSATRVFADGFTDVASAVFEPGGSRVAFTGTTTDEFGRPQRALHVVDVTGGTPLRLLGDHRLAGTPLVAWSTDGRAIYFTGDGICGQGGCQQGPLFRIDPNGASPPVQVTDTPVESILSWTN